MSTHILKTMLQLISKICWRRRRISMPDEREMRLRRLHALREQGINPYPNRVQRTHTISEVLQHFDEWQGPEGSFTLVGRIRLMREMGKAAFFKIEDGTGSIQLYFRINDIGEEAYQALKLPDLRDPQSHDYCYAALPGRPRLH